MAWTDSLTAQPGDFTAIQGLLTQANGIVLDDIYSALESWILAQPNPDYESMTDLIEKHVAVSCEAGDVPGLSPDSVASLKTLGLIESRDARHIQPTMLGWQFIQAMRNN